MNERYQAIEPRMMRPKAEQIARTTALNCEVYRYWLENSVQAWVIAKAAALTLYGGKFDSQLQIEFSSLLSP